MFQRALILDEETYDCTPVVAATQDLPVGDNATARQRMTAALPRPAPGRVLASVEGPAQSLDMIGTDSQCDKVLM